MSVSPNDIPDLFSENNGVGNFIPATTFAYLYLQKGGEVLVALFLYAVLVGTHRIIIKHRKDTPSGYSTIGKWVSGFPLFLLYPYGLGRLFCFTTQSTAAPANTISALGLFLLAVNLSYLFGMAYLSWVDIR